MASKKQDSRRKVVNVKDNSNNKVNRVGGVIHPHEPRPSDPSSHYYYYHRAAAQHPHYFPPPPYPPPFPPYHHQQHIGQRRSRMAPFDAAATNINTFNIFRNPSMDEETEMRRSYYFPNRYNDEAFPSTDDRISSSNSSTPLRSNRRRNDEREQSFEENQTKDNDESKYSGPSQEEGYQHGWYYPYYYQYENMQEPYPVTPSRHSEGYPYRHPSYYYSEGDPYPGYGYGYAPYPDVPSSGTGGYYFPFGNSASVDEEESSSIPVPPTTPYSPIRRKATSKVTPSSSNEAIRKRNPGESAFPNNELSDDTLSPKKDMDASAKTASAVTEATWNDREHAATTTPSPARAKGSRSGGNNSGTFVTLQDSDIVVGRGAPTNYHIGNQFFRELVADFHTQYFIAKRADKPVIAMRVLDILKERGARFVRREKGARALGGGAKTTPGGGSWVVVSNKLAYEKVCAALRDGAPEVGRKMMNSSHKIREALLQERNQEEEKHHQQERRNESSFFFGGEDSLEKENGYN